MGTVENNEDDMLPLSLLSSLLLDVGIDRSLHYQLYKMYDEDILMVKIECCREGVEGGCLSAMPYYLFPFSMAHSV
jgi:hypothetical protein